jgi:hypothetical protein
LFENILRRKLYIDLSILQCLLLGMDFLQASVVKHGSDFCYILAISAKTA